MKRLLALSIAVVLGISVCGFSQTGIDQVSTSIYDAANNTIKVFVGANGAGGTPGNADQVFTSIYNATNNAIAVTCLSGCGNPINPSPATLNGILYGTGTSTLNVTAAGGTGTLCLVETNGGTPAFGSCAGSAATAWSSLTAGTLTGGGSYLVGSGTTVAPTASTPGTITANSYSGQLPIANGGTGASTAGAGFSNLAPAPVGAGSLIYWNGTTWAVLAGNTSTNPCLQESSSGVPSFGACGGGSGTVTSVGLAAPAGFSVTGSPVTGSGTLTLGMPSGWTTGDLLLGNGSNSVARLGIGSNGQCLTSNGTTAAWGSCAGGSIGGTGTAQTLAMFTAASTIGNSQVTQATTTGTISISPASSQDAVALQLQPSIASPTADIFQVYGPGATPSSSCATNSKCDFAIEANGNMYMLGNSLTLGANNQSVASDLSLFGGTPGQAYVELSSAALSPPAAPSTSAPTYGTLTTATSGGSLPTSTTYDVDITYCNGSSCAGETTVSVTGTVTTGSGVLSVPGAPTVTPTGTTGSSTWSYECTAVNAAGETTASAAGSTSTGNATLTATNYNAVACPSVTGAASENIYRTASGGTPSTTGKIGNVSNGGTLNDTGLAGSGSAPGTNTAGANTVSMTSPAPATNATAYKVYVKTTAGGNFFLQNGSSGTAIGTNYTMTSENTSSSAPPSANTTGGLYQSFLSMSAEGSGILCSSSSVPGSDCAGGTTLVQQAAGAPATGDVATWSGTNQIQDGGVLLTALPTFTGTITAGDCVKWSTATAITDAGAACGTGGATSWSAITNPSANLSLTMGANTTTFNSSLTSAAFTWQQSTAATSSANQNSPALVIGGTVWNGTASANDQWTLQDVPKTGSEPETDLTLSQSGSTSGKSAFSIASRLLIEPASPDTTGSGTLLINQPTSSTGPFANWQVNGHAYFYVSDAGQINALGGLTIGGASVFNCTGATSAICINEGSSPTGAAGVDDLWADSGHVFRAKLNNGPALDIATSGVNAIAFSTTPSLDMSKGNVQQFSCTTAGSAISPTTANLRAGEIMTFVFIQNGTTACTVTFPSNMHAATTVGTTLSGINTQQFVVTNNGTDLYAVGVGIQNMTGGTP